MAEEIINMYSTDKNVYFTVSEHRTLKSPSRDDDAYTLYLLKPYGYAVLFNDSFALMEACYQPDVEIPIDCSESITHYYGGFCSFLTQENGKWKDQAGNYLDAARVDSMSIAEASARSYEENKAVYMRDAVATTSKYTASANNRSSNLVSYYVEKDYFEGLTKFGSNTQGTCTLLAVSILLGYYDNFVSDSYVLPMYEDGNGTNDLLHRDLNFVHYGREVPSTLIAPVEIFEVADTVNIYLDVRGITANFAHNNILDGTSTFMNRIVSELRDDQRPLVIGVWELMGAEWNHTMVLYGVTYDTSNMIDTAVFYAHTGWHNNSEDYPLVYAFSAGWATSAGYIECGLDYHGSSLSWGPLNSLYHVASCHCGAKLQELHTLKTAADGSKYCNKCGWGGGISVIDSFSGDCDSE